MKNNKKLNIAINALKRLENWTEAYPLEIFPEPDFIKVKEALHEKGLSLDQVSASNMRYVVSKINDIVKDALNEIDS